MEETMQEQKEREIRESMDKLYPKDPDHLYSKMLIEFYSCSYEKKRVTLRFPIQRWELNHMSTVHGGIIAAAMDNTCRTAFTSVTGKTTINTINLNINYMSPGMAGDARLVTARADRAGRRICNISAQCKSEKTGKLIATAAANFMIEEEKMGQSL